jgi:hypothetical protein
MAGNARMDRFVIRSKCYEYVSTMNPNVLDASINVKFAVVLGKMSLTLQVSTRDYEYADRSYIGLELYKIMGVQTTGKGTQNKIINPTYN